MTAKQKSTATDSTKASNDRVCIPNISRKERQKRLLSGVIQLIISLAILAVLLAIDANRWWRLALFPLFWAATAGFFQWQEKT
jgi:hypothetical protein